jgi:hypothetical protein
MGLVSTVVEGHFRGIPGVGQYKSSILFADVSGVENISNITFFSAHVRL